MLEVYDLLLKMENKKEIILDWIYEDKVIYDEEDESYHHLHGDSGVSVTGHSEDDFDELIPVEDEDNIYFARTSDWEYSFSGESIFKFLKHLKEYGLDLSTILNCDDPTIEETEDKLTITVIRSEF